MSTLDHVFTTTITINGRDDFTASLDQSMDEEFYKKKSNTNANSLNVSPKPVKYRNIVKNISDKRDSKIIIDN